MADINERHPEVGLAVFFPRAEDTYYVKAKPGEIKSLDAAELERIRLLTGRELSSAADDPLYIHEWVGQKLLDHIAAQDAEIARLKAVEAEFKHWKESGMLDLDAMPRRKRPDLVIGDD